MKDWRTSIAGAQIPYLTMPDGPPRLMVFIDTEEEFDWSAPMRRDGYGVRSVQALPVVQSLFSRLGITPCYLIDYPIVSDHAACAVLQGFVDAGEAMIGTQLHPWVNPPFAEELNPYNSYPGNLPADIEAAKLGRLTAAIADRFGTRPQVYRAGRYGLGPNTPALLAELGYKVDCSVRPFFDYRPDGGPSFQGVLPRPFWLSQQAGLLEIPLTVGFTGALSGLGDELFALAARFGQAPGFLARAGLLNRVPLTPEGTNLDEALAGIDALAAAEQPIYCISFHSPSVEPGHTPYVRDAADLARFLAWLEAVLEHLMAKIGAVPATPLDVWSLCAAGLARHPVAA